MAILARDIASDIWLKPRVKAFLADHEFEPQGDIDSRETLLPEANSDEVRAGAEEFRMRLLHPRPGIGDLSCFDGNPLACPEISRDTARDLAACCRYS